MVDLASWALSGTTREPTTTEISEGFLCDTPPRDLFNWSHNLQMVTAANRHMSAEAIQNDPPGAPTNGKSWIVGTTPTGAWVGHANEIATWLKDDWAFNSPKSWMLVGLADLTDWRWDQTLATPAWINWADRLLAEQKSVRMIAQRSTSLTLAQSTVTAVTSFDTVDSYFLDPATTFSGGILTIGPLDAGIWTLSGYMSMGVNAETFGVCYIYKNNSNARPNGLQRTSNGTLYASVSVPLELTDGDEVNFRMFQNRNPSGSEVVDVMAFEAVRLGKA